ncbi:hypothetical protein F2Q70_00034498 [Brassica cretica]|uniref:Uncharacterized protein n=1 Tax=Brassica cretica TaxID=69181 RepID=A0A8S9JXH2_BRACR|nr:hypothetical protein F2Q70_00034498 [Brassica cretica]
MGMLVERRRCKRGYGGTPNGYGGYAGGDVRYRKVVVVDQQLYPPIAAKEVLVKELMVEDMKVVVVKEVVSRHGSSGGFSVYGGMEFIVVDGCGSGGGEKSGYG